MRLIRRHLRLARREEGQALLMVVFMIAALTLLTPLLMDTVSDSSSRSADSQVRAKSRAAADAGINDYVSKMLLDNQYYLQYVAPGEATRHPASGSDVSSVLPPTSPTPWPSSGGVTWTYPSKDAWVDLGNGYSYDLEIVPPNSTGNPTSYVQITATGKQNGASSATNSQVLQVLIRPASIADFQMLSHATVTYGSAATTYGKIYSGNNINFDGTAYADLYAENQVNLTGSIVSPAQYYDSNTNPTIRTPIKSPINFADFQVSLTDVKRAAANAGGIYLNNPSASAWQLTFAANGTVSWKSCSAQAQSVQTSQPTCNGTISNLNTALLGGAGTGTLSIPVNGAIYSDQDILIGPATATCGTPSLTNANCVHGRVTVASGQDVVIGDDIEYVNRSTDVLGVIGQNNVWVASWTGNNLTWRAAALAENGVWSQPSGVTSGSHNGTMTFYGATATYNGGAMDMFDFRSYNYDANLQYLQPPWFPTLQQAYTILLYRNLPNSS